MARRGEGASTADADAGEQARQAFIRAHTRLQPVPLVPEVCLYLADAVTPLWQMTAAALGAHDVPPPFWAFAWAGGQALARYILDHPAEVAGRAVLDLATGSGLCAIAALRAGAASALAADVDPYCAAAVALNAAANGVSPAFTAQDLLDAPPPPDAVILAGDVCYEAPLAARVLAWLRAAHAQGSRVLLGDPGRRYLPVEALTPLAAYAVPTSREIEDAAVKRGAVYTLAGPAG